MNLQDVSHIHIPDGDVRMIHDSDNRLLWGAVGYNVLFSGNTYQQTYTGKNLFNAGAPISDRYITDAGTWAQGQGASRYINQEYSSTPNTTYAFSFSAKTSGAFVRFAEFDNNGVFTKRTLINTSGATITTRSDTAKILWSIDARSSNHFTDLQIEQGSTVTSYEPYVGGQPSPNPSYPQQIQTVTGTQTISINGTNYPLDLGSIELCKIGTYQDYIYKSGDDWKVHKAITTITVDGSEDWQYNGDNKFNANYINGMAIPINASALCYCRTHVGVLSAVNGSEFTPLVADKPYATDVHKLTNMVRFKDIRFTTTQGLSAWLAENNTTIYYVVETPTDTTITDTDLIAQLEAIYNLVRRYGYNFVVSASGNNLPIIIDRTLL